MNNPIDWSGNTDPSRDAQEAWRQYFRILLDSVKAIVTDDFHANKHAPYDDPVDFVNGFTLAGAFFSGLYLEQNPEHMKRNVYDFRVTLSDHLMRIINQLERDERRV